ncbi:MAG: acetate uptake transporter, partial [Jatrophihabitantaceae bacterium]
MAVQGTTRHDAPVTPPLSAGSGIADPGQLGLAGFALTTFVLSCYNAKLIGTGEGVVLGLALAYGGIAQLLAGMWEFVKGNTFGAVAFSSYGGFWLSFWYLVNHLPADAKGNDLPHGLGVYLLGWGIFTTYMFIASTRVSGAVMAVFAALALTYFALAIGNFGISEGWTKFGGWLGLITAV